MRVHLLTVAIATAAMVALTGCATTVAGSAVPAINPQDMAGSPSAGEDLILPEEGDSIPGLGDLFNGDEGMPDLGELFGNLGGDDGGPDLGELFGNLGGEDGAPDLGELFGNLGGGEGMPDLGELFGNLGDVAGSMGAIGMSEECSAELAATASAMGLFMTPAMGGTITQEQVDRAFDRLADAPTGSAEYLDVLADAAQRMVDKSAAEARTILDEPAVTAAMDGLDDHFNEACGGE